MGLVPSVAGLCGGMQARWRRPGALRQTWLVASRGSLQTQLWTLILCYQVFHCVNLKTVLQALLYCISVTDSLFFGSCRDVLSQALNTNPGFWL